MARSVERRGGTRRRFAAVVASIASIVSLVVIADPTLVRLGWAVGGAMVVVLLISVLQVWMLRRVGESCLDMQSRQREFEAALLHLNAAREDEAARRAATEAWLALEPTFYQTTAGVEEPAGPSNAKSPARLPGSVSKTSTGKRRRVH